MDALCHTVTLLMLDLSLNNLLTCSLTGLCKKISRKSKSRFVFRSFQKPIYKAKNCFREWLEKGGYFSVLRTYRSNLLPVIGKAASFHDLMLRSLQSTDSLKNFSFHADSQGTFAHSKSFSCAASSQYLYSADFVYCYLYSKQGRLPQSFNLYLENSHRMTNVFQTTVIFSKFSARNATFSCSYYQTLNLRLIHVQECLTWIAGFEGCP